jgi:hypothetical protein
MYAECIRHLGVSKFPNGVFVDGTFGRGGHTRKILEAMGPSGELHAFDMDPEAIEVGKQLEREDARFHIHHAPFSSMYEVLTSERYRARLSQFLCPLYPSLIYVFAKIVYKLKIAYSFIKYYYILFTMYYFTGKLATGLRD